MLTSKLNRTHFLLLAALIGVTAVAANANTAPSLAMDLSVAHGCGVDPAAR